MREFNVGDIVTNDEGTYKILDVDKILHPIPWYTAVNLDTNRLIVGALMDCNRNVDEETIVAKGKIIVEDKIGPYTVKVINYFGDLYFVETFYDSNIVQCKKLNG